MSIYRLYVSAPSSEMLRHSMGSLPHLVADAPAGRWFGSWSGDAGQYVVIGGQSRDAITQIVESCGLAVDSIDRLRRLPLRPPACAFPGDDVWCPQHHAYHAPPAHALPSQP